MVEHGVDYAYEELAQDGGHPASLRGRTPSGRGVPVLVVRDDLVLWDATAIVQWVDSAFARPLTPSTRAPAALARAWEGWIVSTMYRHVDDARLVDDADCEDLVDALRGLEGLVDTTWIAGDEFSIADVALGPIICVLSPEALSTLPPRTRAYAARLRGRSSVRVVGELDLSLDRRSFAA